MHVRSVVLSTLVAAATALAACSSDNRLGLGLAGPGTSPDTLNNARIRFVNATATSLDVAAGGSVGVGNGAIGFGGSSSCISANATTPNLAVRAAGSTSALPGLTTAFQSGVSYVVVAYPGTNGATQFATIADTYTPPSGQGGMRVFNAGTTSYDVYVTAPGAALASATPTVAAVTSGSASPFASVSTSATQQVRITAAGSAAVLLDAGNVAFVADRNVTLVIAPPLAGSTAPRAFFVSDC